MPTLMLSSNCEKNREINEMTKDFSVCANTFSHSVKTKSTNLTCGQPNVMPEVYGEDEAAKDCL